MTDLLGRDPPPSSPAYGSANLALALAINMSGKRILKINQLSEAEIEQLCAEARVRSDLPDKAVCPIIEEHVVMVGRISNHMADCRRKNVHLGFVPCPFNRFHYLKPSQMVMHKQVCPDRQKKLVQPKDHRADAQIQVAELKFQCGLPLTAQELELLGQTRR